MYSIKMKDQTKPLPAATVVYTTTGLSVYAICNDGETIQPISVTIPYNQIETLTLQGKDVTHTIR